ncbi:MAG: hypothetical protein HQ517_12260, partial [SAR324 cluster bacterium]|nr:hypothetical protein [SAR324 cluster bacterium]
MKSDSKLKRHLHGFILIPVLAFIAISCDGFSAGKFPYSTSVSGRVTSGYGHIEGVEVRIPGEKNVAVTDKEGRFTLSLGLLQGDRFRVVAGKEGWFNNGKLFLRGQDIEIYLNPVPRTDRHDYQFQSPKVCAQCHVKLTQIYDQSKMAHTTSNPKVLQMYNGTDALNKAGQGPGFRPDNPGNDGDCISCHAPSVAAADPKSGDLNKALTSPRAEWDGISCDYCHKIRRVVKSSSSPSGFKAVHQRQTPLNGNAILEFGPYKDVSVPPMAASYSSVFEKGQYCSVCHSHRKTLKNRQTWDWEKVYSKEEWQAFDLENNSVLPVQTTYQEWKQWQTGLAEKDPNKGKTCQNCHMSWRKDMLPYDNYVVNGHIQQMWGTYRSAEIIHPHQFDGGTEIQLKTAVSVEVKGKIEKNSLLVTVYVTNTNGGHWIPTGETMRSLMLILDVKDQNDKQLKMISGNRLPDWTGKGKPELGNYAGLPGVAFAKVLKDDKGRLNVPFWNATAIVVDNRIRPKTTVTHEWRFALNSADSEPTAVARLIYRPVFK